MIGLIDLFDPLEDSPSEMMELCKFGIKLAESMDSSRFKAYFTAQKAYFVSCDFIDTDMKMFFDIRASNLVGIPFVTEPQRQETLSRLRHYQEEYNSLFDEALSLLVKSNDAEMMGGVLIIIGNAAGQRALIYRQLGITERYKYEKNLSKNSLLLAKNIYVKVGDEEGIALALHNLANQLRFFDEKDEALALVEETKEVARKLGNKNFLQKAMWSQEVINTGKIPDYIHGEKRKPSI